MRSIVAGCVFGLWIWAVAGGQVAPRGGSDKAAEAVAAETTPAATGEETAASQPGEATPAGTTTAGAAQSELAGTEAGQSGLATMAAGPVSQPATQPAALRIGGLPARQWLNAAAPVQSHNLEGRLWAVGVLEPWSERSRRAAGELATVARAWSARGMDILLVTVAPAEEVSKYPGLASLALPIGAGSQLPLLVPLEALPTVYVVGPDYTVAWTGPAAGLASALPRLYERVAPAGLAQARENELTNRLNRAEAAFSPGEPFTVPASAEKYFIATGLASAVADATPASHPLHGKAAELLAKVDQQGQRLLDNVRELLTQGRFADAHVLLEGVAEGFYGRAVGRRPWRCCRTWRRTRVSRRRCRRRGTSRRRCRHCGWERRR